MIVRGETYDWLRSSVNEFWYNQFVTDCNLFVPPLNTSILLSTESKSCSRTPSSVHLNRKFSRDLVSDIYFDEVLVESAKQNQCQFDYWSALSTKDSKAFDNQKNANQKLGTQFSPLKDDLKSHPFSDRDKIFPTIEGETASQQSQNAQKKIVDQLVDAAYKIAKKERELKYFLAQNPLYTTDPRKSPKAQVEKMQNELNVLESSFVFSEDNEVKSFVKYTLVEKIKESFAFGKEPNIQELKNFYLSDPKSNFQAQVVDRKLNSIANEQANYADIDGRYDDNYSFKVIAVQSGVGAKVLNDKVKQNSNFSRLQCEMDSKYGKGEQIASTANTAVIAGVTLAFGGSALLLGRLAQIGMTSQRAARLAQTISTFSNSAISGAEIAHGLVESCRQPHFQKKDSSICSRVKSVKEIGIGIQINSEIDHSDCLTDMGLAALSGAMGFKAAMKAKQLKRDQQLLQLGLKDRYNTLLANIKNDVKMTPAQKKQLASELDRSISISSLDNFPRQEFLNSLAKEDSADLLEALKQINNDTAGATWAERVKSWISSKRFNKKEAAELESCLIDGASKTSKCSLAELLPDS